LIGVYKFVPFGYKLRESCAALSVYKYGLRLSASLGGNVLIMLNARNEHDRTKFVDDLKESILEVSEI